MSDIIDALFVFPYNLFLLNLVGSLIFRPAETRLSKADRLINKGSASLSEINSKMNVDVTCLKMLHMLPTSTIKKKTVFSLLSKFVTTA